MSRQQAVTPLTSNLKDVHKQIGKAARVREASSPQARAGSRRDEKNQRGNQQQIGPLK